MCDCLCGVCHDDKIETLNAFLIPQTFYPENRSDSLLGCINMGLCLWSPVRLLEALALMGYGILTCPVPCCACKTETYHSNNDISIECLYPACTWLKSPCHYKNYQSGRHTQGCTIGMKNCGNIRPKGSEESYLLTSYTPRGICFMGGLGKLTSVLCDIAFCPVTACCWSWGTCCK